MKTINKTTEMRALMARIFLITCLVSGVSLYATETDGIASVPATTSILRPYACDEVMVLFKDDGWGAESGNAKVNTRAIRGTVVRQYAAGKKKLLRVKLPKGTSVEKAIAENWGLSDSRILRVEPNYNVSALGLSNDTYLSYQWAIENTGQNGGTAECDINASAAWDITTGSYNAIVAVIDTGVDYNHPDLYNQIWVNSDEIPNNNVDDDNNGYVDDYLGWDCVGNDKDPDDEHGHGTHCAGIIAGEGNNGQGIAGVNWQCQIMACRFLNASGSGTIADAIEAVNYAVANGAHVLSNSWGGGGYSATLHAAIENAKNHGVLFVAAAGNSASNNDVTATYPAGYAVSNVISVAATDNNDRLASFSCYGATTVHVGAPGVSILSSVPGGYSYMSGTSMATPYVSGAAAMLLSAYPEMGLTELKNRLIWCGDEVAALRGKTLTSRRLNVYAALVAEDNLEIQAPAEGTHWVTGFDYTIKWISIGGGSAVDIYLAQDGQAVEAIAEDVANEGSYTWSVPARIANGSYTILVDDGSLLAESGAITIDDQRTDYFTEWFSDHLFDLTKKSVIFVPDGSGGYEALAHSITALPTSPSGGKKLSLRDDEARTVTLASGKTVSFYGTSYTKFYVGSNGYITFGTPDTEYRSTAAYHFSKKRISGLFEDLNPARGGEISYKQWSDRIAVTWNNIPRYCCTSQTNTFQIELYFNGRIRISWIKNTGTSVLTGLSKGEGLAQDFMSSDMSAYSTYEPALRSISIQGSKSILNNATLALSCVSKRDFGITQTVGSEDGLVWNAIGDIASIDSDGILTVGDVSGIFQPVLVTASYGGKNTSLKMCVKNDGVRDFTVSRSSVTSGSSSSYNNYVMTGRLSISSTAIARADSIRVKLWTSQNTCVYNSSFAVSSRYYSRGVFNRSKTSGVRTELLRVDAPKGIVSLTIKNINLKGTNAPSYFTLECGSYQYAGTLN